MPEILASTNCGTHPHVPLFYSLAPFCLKFTCSLLSVKNLCLDPELGAVAYGAKAYGAKVARRHRQWRRALRPDGDMAMI